MTRHLSFCLVGIVALAFCACGGDNGSSAATIDLGDDDKVLSSITETEAETICQSIGAFMGSAMKDSFAASTNAMCVGMALQESATDTSVSCKESYDACIASDPMGPATDFSELEDDCASSVVAGFENCDATLGEIEVCYRDMATAFAEMAEVMEALSCSSTIEELQAFSSSIDSDEGFEQPASCQAISAKCPGFMDDDGPDSDGQDAGGYDLDVISETD